MGLGPSTPDDQLNVVFCPWGAQVPDPPVQQVGWTPPEPGRTGLVRAPGGCLSNAQMVPVVTQCNASDVNQHFRYNYTSKVLTQNTTTGVRCLGYSTWG